MIVSTMPPFQRAVYFLHKFFLSRPCLARGPCIPSSSRPFLYDTSCVCSVFFIPPICQIGTRYFLFVVTKFEGLFHLRGLHIGYSRSSLSIIRKWIVHILGSVRAYCLTNLVRFSFFWLPVIRHYLRHFRPVFADFRFRCNRPRFSFTVPSVSCVRERVARFISVFFLLPLLKGRWSFGVQF